MDVHPPGTDTHPMQMYTNTNTHMQKTSYSQMETDTCGQKPFKSTHCSARNAIPEIHRLTDAQMHICAVRTHRHRHTPK